VSLDKITRRLTEKEKKREREREREGGREKGGKGNGGSWSGAFCSRPKENIMTKKGGYARVKGGGDCASRNADAYLSICIFSISLAGK